MAAKMKPRVGSRVVRALTDIRDTVKSGVSLDEKFTVRTVILDLDPHEYNAREIQNTRALLGASQAIFAQIIGASVETVESWEQGIRTPSTMARRLLDEINFNPERWRDVLRNSRHAVEL